VLRVVLSPEPDAFGLGQRCPGASPSAGNLLPLIKTVVSGNTLQIDSKEDLAPTKTISIILFSTSLAHEFFERVAVALILQPDPVAKPDCRNYRFC
jgi:hypothetical protein